MSVNIRKRRASRSMVLPRLGLSKINFSFRPTLILTLIFHDFSTARSTSLVTIAFLPSSEQPYFVAAASVL